MILHKTDYQNTLYFTLFDSEERVALYPTRYLNSLDSRRRSLPSKRQIANIVKIHCHWLENATYFSGLRMDEILAVVCSDNIKDWINFQRLAGISEITIHNREVLIRQMYQYFTTQEAGKLRLDIPWQNGYYTKAQQRKIPRFLTPEQLIKLLLGFYHESQRAAAHFAYDTGLRVSELVRLKVSQLPDPRDYPHWFNYYPLIVEGSKASDGNQYKIRETIISRAVLARVQRYHQTIQYQSAKGWAMNDLEKPVFLNIHGEKLTSNSFYCGIKFAWKRQGGDPSDVSPHRLRHGTGYSVLRGEFGNDLQDRLLILKGMYGHNHIKTTEIYCSIPLVVLESLNNNLKNKPRFEEADEIYRLTYLPAYKNTSKRGARGK